VIQIWKGQPKTRALRIHGPLKKVWKLVSKEEQAEFEKRLSLIQKEEGVSLLASTVGKEIEVFVKNPEGNPGVEVV